MKNFFWRKVPLVIVPTALIVTPLLTFAISNKNFSNDKPSDANYEQEIEQIIHNQNLSLQEKINQLQDKLKTLGNNTLDILKNLNSELDNLKHLNECQTYLTKLNWETNLSNTLPSKFSKQKNQLFDLKLLNLKSIPKFTNVDFEYKLIKIDDYEGTLTIEINLKYQVKYVSKIQQTIHGFKKYTETSNENFENMAGFLAGLQNIKNQNTVGLFPKEDKISALITEIYNIFPNSKNYLTLKVANENTKISDIIDKDTNIIKLSLQLIDDKNQKTQQFKNVNFKITNHTIYLNSNNQKQITLDNNLSNINTKEIIKLGFYQESQGVVRVPKMPKTIEKVPNELPSEITSLKEMFEDCFNFNQDLSSWDVSNVTDMSYMFYRALKFNGNISSWNTSQVTNMKYMFANHSPHDRNNFNQDISSWNVSKVTNMERMFYQTSIFNQNISKWETSNVINMSGLFQGAKKFDQVIYWNTSNVTDMSFMFAEAEAFNQEVWHFETSNVTNMSGMFKDAKNFKFNISPWNTSNVKDMSNMFFNASKYNSDLSRLNVDKVTNYENFATKAKFANNLKKQPQFIDRLVTKYIDHKGREQKSISKDLSNIYISIKIRIITKIGFYQESENVIRAVRMPKTVEKVPSKLPSEITSLQDMFKECKDFNQDLSNWDTSNVTDMSYMFWSAEKFNNGDEAGKSTKPLTWNTSSVTHMNSMFSRNPAFNQNISSWNVNKVTNMDSMFYNASKFNQNISKWDTSNVTNMRDMFANASSFNQNLSKWNVDKVTNHENFPTNSGFKNESYKWPAKFRKKK